jgi:hypothetical protein
VNVSSRIVRLALLAVTLLMTFLAGAQTPAIH